MINELRDLHYAFLLIYTGLSTIIASFLAAFPSLKQTFFEILDKYRNNSQDYEPLEDETNYSVTDSEYVPYVEYKSDVEDDSDNNLNTVDGGKKTRKRRGKNKTRKKKTKTRKKKTKMRKKKNKMKKTKRNKKRNKKLRKRKRKNTKKNKKKK